MATFSKRKNFEKTGINNIREVTLIVIPIINKTKLFLYFMVVKIE